MFLCYVHKWHQRDYLYSKHFHIGPFLNQLKFQVNTIYFPFLCSNNLLISATELGFDSSSWTTPKFFGNSGFLDGSATVGFGFFVGIIGTFFGTPASTDACAVTLSGVLPLLSGPVFDFSGRFKLPRSFRGRVRKFGFFFDALEALPGTSCRGWNCSCLAPDFSGRGAGFGISSDVLPFAGRGAGIGARMHSSAALLVATETPF